MLEIYKPVEVVDNGGLFQIHPYPNPNCPIGANIQSVIEGTLFSAQDAMESVLEKVTMLDIVADIVADINKKIK